MNRSPPAPPVDRLDGRRVRPRLSRYQNRARDPQAPPSAGRGRSAVYRANGSAGESPYPRLWHSQAFAEGRGVSGAHHLPPPDAITPASTNFLILSMTSYGCTRTWKLVRPFDMTLFDRSVAHGGRALCALLLRWRRSPASSGDQRDAVSRCSPVGSARASFTISPPADWVLRAGEFERLHLLALTNERVRGACVRPRDLPARPLRGTGCVGRPSTCASGPTPLS